MKYLLSIVLLVLMCAINTVFAAKQVSAGDLILGKFNANLKIARLVIARDILRGINALDDLVYNLTPAEMAWINTERRKSKIFTDRYIHFLNTPEFQNYMLKDYLRAAKDSLHCVIESDTIAKEMYCWGYVSYLLVDLSKVNDAVMILKENQKIPSDLRENETFLVNDDGRYNANYHSYGEGILRYILMPYLSGAKMDL